MQRLVIFTSLVVAAIGLSSCGVAEGLAKAVSRTGGSVGRSVSGLGGALGR